jgi:hypothetical protein
MEPAMVESAAKRVEPVHTEYIKVGTTVGAALRQPHVLRWDSERVELAFASIALRDVCESRQRATTTLGTPDAARELEGRLADLRAAANVTDFNDLFPGDIVNRSPTERAVRLTTGHDIVFAPGHVVAPFDADQGIDWTKVTRIRILALEARDG